MTLRPAQEVRDEVDSKKSNSREKAIQKQLADLAKKIEDHKHQGHINHLTVMSEVELALTKAGYSIQHHSAAHCGDMDSITISW